MLNNPFDSTLRKHVHPSLIPYLIAKQQPRRLHVESSDKFDRHSCWAVRKQNMVPGQLCKRKCSQNFFVNPNGIQRHSKTDQNDGSSYCDAMKGTI